MSRGPHLHGLREPRAGYRCDPQAQRWPCHPHWRLFPLNVHLTSAISVTTLQVYLIRERDPDPSLFIILTLSQGTVALGLHHLPYRRPVVFSLEPG